MTIRGTGTALITPFRPDYSIDAEALHRLVADQIEHGVDFLVVLGTTGEAATMTEQEKAQVTGAIAQQVSGRIPMVLGMSGNATAALCQQIRQADFTGYEAILSVTPYYNRPSQEGLYRHFAAVAEASAVPVILYNVPSRTGVNLDASTTLRLAHDFPGQIIAVKEASGRLGQIRELIERRPEGFNVLSGDDALTLPLIAMGAVGVISVAANVLPQMFAHMVRLCLQGDFHTAARFDRPMQKMYRTLFAEGNPAGVKAMLAIKGICGDTLRLPLVGVSERLRQEMQPILQSLLSFK